MASPSVPYSGPIITRKQARENGLKRYFSGVPCKYGHLSERNTITKLCLLCRPHYRSKWTGRTPKSTHLSDDSIKALSPREEAIRNGDDRYFTGKPCRRGHLSPRYTNGHACVACGQQYHIENIEKAKEANAKATRLYRSRHAARIKEMSDAWKANNVEKRRATKRRYLRANREKLAVIRSRRRARAKQAGGKHTEQDIAMLLVRQSGQCANCKKSIKDRYDVDHIEPLARGGSNDASNLQLLCSLCNRKKGAKDPYEWAQMNGRLF